jgi:hypothetical protein
MLRVMPTDPRIIVTGFDGGLDLFPIITYQTDEHSCTGVWSRPKVPALIFADNSHDGTPVTFHHGAIGGAQTPVQLIFWGDWWAGAGSAQRGLIESRTQSLLASHYFTELSQYHIGGAPAWRGSTIVSRPGPPLGGVSSTVAMQRVLELIEKSIDDGIFPDPDDGPRFAFIVLMPQGFTVTGGTVAGAHSSDYTFDFPFDTDRYWAGWVRFFDPATEDAELTMSTLGHELVELLTDPEGDGWRREPLDSNCEIADWSNSTVAGNAVRQRAWVNDVRVQSYWSVRHGATVIPIDNDYAAQLQAKVSETSRREVSRGNLVPDPAIRRACSKFPACCINDDDYEFVVYSVSETARIRLNTVRYHTPKASWSIQGIAVSGSGTVHFDLPVDGYSGNDPVSSVRRVAIGYAASDTVLDLTVADPGGNFDLSVSCSVVDASIVGNLATNVIATPSVVVGFVGADLVADPAYIDALGRCHHAMLKKYMDEYLPMGRPGPGDPIQFDPTVLNIGLPAYARVAGHQQLQETGKLIRAAAHVLEPDDAHEFVGYLLRSQPALVRTLQTRGLADLTTTVLSGI